MLKFLVESWETLRVKQQNDSEYQPFHAMPYQVPVSQQELVKKEIEHLLLLEVIKPVEKTEYAAAAFSVPKENRQIRLVINYRRLNKALKRSPHVFPQINAIINEVAIQRPRMFSSLDLIMGYCTIGIREEFRNLTTFVLPWGQYRFKKMPFGLSTASDIF